MNRDLAVVAEEFRRAEESVAHAYGDFVFFGLVEMEDAPGHWELIASAPWIGKGAEGINVIVDRINAYFDVKDWKFVSAVVPLATTSDFVQAITRKYHLEHQVEEIGNVYVNGVYISHAFLITSNPSPAPARVIAEPVAA